MSTCERAATVVFGRKVLCHKLCGISTYRLNGLRKGDEHPTNPSLWGMVPFNFTFLLLYQEQLLGLWTWMWEFFFTMALSIITHC